jgi:cob(I)alamin adenosyltransferase
MVTLTKIYTRGGDKGKTSLGNGARVEKSAIRVAAYGTVDEANAAVGVARLHTRQRSAIDEMLQRIQNELFDLGADLCTPDDSSKSALRIVQGQLDRLESEIDSLNAHLSPLRSFVLPAGDAAASHLHLARCIVRRAERHIVELVNDEDINPLALAYVNRLSDHLFVLARYLNSEAEGDVLWVPGASR